MTTTKLHNGDEMMLVEVLGNDNPFPLKDVLQKLIIATEILLYKKDYDGGDYEEMNICVKRAKDIVILLETKK